MPAIVLATLNARWSHASMGLRCLRANLGPLREDSVIREFTINDDPAHIVEALLADPPTILGLGIYIWNREPTRRVLQLLRAVAPEIRIVVGGPEVSFGHDLGRLVDVTITGEGDVAFRQVCEDLMAGRPVAAVVAAPKPDLATLELPMGEYTAEDLAHRIIYVEASRGCPFTCEFCLSSIEDGVRNVPLERFLAALDDLLARGCTTFKFVDRTFNLSPTISAGILTFFLDRWRDGLFLHFEMVPDRLPDGLKALLVRFPPGAVQLEIGIQSFTPEVGRLISRRMDRAKTEANLRWLTASTGIHLHTDLIIGLPGETLDSLRTSFDALWSLGPQEIQVGILKLLPGTPLARHVEPFAMAFNPAPPYDLLASRDFPFPLMQRLKRFAKYFDLFVNHGHFPACIERLAGRGPSPFMTLLAFSDALWAATGQDHALARPRQYDLLIDHLVTVGIPEAEAIDLAAQDAARSPVGKGLPNRMHAAWERHRRHAAASGQADQHPVGGLGHADVRTTGGP